MHVIKPPTVCDRLLEASKFEYKTRHLIDGQIVQCDQRISIVAGYMSTEVCGLSPFLFMHKDDVRWVIVALRQSEYPKHFYPTDDITFSSSLSVYDYSSIGESCYRLLTPTGDFIYLKTRGCLDIDRDTNEVRSFVCLNTMISEEEGRKLIHEMKRKFAIMIQDGEFEEGDDTPGVDDPVHLERAVNRMISNLPNNHSDPDRANLSSPSDTYTSDDQESESGRSIRSPPVRRYVTPQPDSIKVSIGKTLKVVETATSSSSDRHSRSEKSLSPAIKSNNPEPIGLTQSSVSPANNARPTVLQKTENYRKSPTKHMIRAPHGHHRIQQQIEPVARGNSVIGVKSSMHHIVQIKDEPLEQRVPPLPTDEDYFEANFAQQRFSPANYSGSCGPRSIKHKPFDYMNHQLQSPTSTSSTTIKRLDGSNYLTAAYNNNNNEGGSPLADYGPMSMLKRKHTIEDIDSTTSPTFTMTGTTKRKMLSTSTPTNRLDPDEALMYLNADPLSAEQPGLLKSIDRTQK